MLLFQIIVTVALAALLANTISNLRWLRQSLRGSTPESTPFVSILVPARNEARSIAACVESLAQQNYPHFEILVLDDNSEDDTAAIVASLAGKYPSVRLLRGQPLPEGWHGKAFACVQLAQAARGEWLLFVDADTVHAPECLTVAMRAAQWHGADLLTMLPRILMGSVGEALLLPIIPWVFGSLMPLGLVTRSRWPLVAGALGPFLLFRREIYQRIGGHAVVRSDIVEDLQLSRLVKQHGGRVLWIDGAGLMRIRFYHSSAEAWRGLAKSTFTAINYSLFALAVGAVGVLAFFVAPYAVLLASIISHHFSVALFALPLAQVLCIALSQLLLAHHFHHSRVMAIFFGATMLAVIACTAFSAYQVLFGPGVVWKGRAYQFRSIAAGSGAQAEQPGDYADPAPSESSLS